ncbi:1-deoxy-D-xylulose-5-phosphate synthase [Coriobacteriia bacterium Es71-Z0120]|uniref:1-deoxy-D-xylulose-5-phosphate synthase n=1 Tax=Parvivirga hydrogeniphila TaxID=2939460 RepID=UPI0022609E4D|nr:1-deoxy-D-xylulose-5-phosphate synthase [Parvivirga hydrogeniphila]MCL4079135.1 1-deoxy-D-xylulose-5-phosphate synthase [Parvivirga hydrogeniphila]
MCAERILDTIDSPADLKGLSREQLEALAAEIRETLIHTVSKTGGHLAPNLGVVELTLGLHRALHCPKDKIVWDVGHQAYVHKLLTGRRERFDTLRTYGGVCGFPKRSESPYDVHDTGHASTSVSVALGLACARDRAGTDETIVAVIGDGSLTGGMAFEALNHLGHLQTRMIVVLNDNEMSISRNVGALASYLGRVRLDRRYRRLRDDVESALARSKIGAAMVAAGEAAKESFKQLLVPGMLFEELGIKYVGPIDGHDIGQVESAVAAARDVDGPVLIHAVTRKGKGYVHAEDRPDAFHGISPFSVESGKVDGSGGSRSYTEVFGRALVSEAERDERIVAITAAMPSGTGLSYFAERFPERFFDVGIAEEHAVGLASGLASGGLLPVVAIYSTFLQRAYDQLIMDVALQGLHVVFALDRAGLVGEDGPTHHGVFDLTYLRSIPGMSIMAPADEAELVHMLHTALVAGGPVAIRYPRGAGAGVELPKTPVVFEAGRSEVRRTGSDVALIAIGRMVSVAEQAADLLAAEGVDATVVNARWVKPLDLEMISEVARGHRLVVTVEENTGCGGFGAAVLEALSDLAIDVPVLRLAAPDCFVTHGATELLLHEIGLDAEGVRGAVLGRLMDLPGRANERRSSAGNPARRRAR